MNDNIVNLPESPLEHRLEIGADLLDRHHGLLTTAQAGLMRDAASRIVELEQQVASLKHTIPTARASDPSTSKTAGCHIRRGSHRTAVLIAFKLFGSAISDEVGRYAGVPGHWKRISELAAAGLIIRTGHERPGDSGSMQTEYRISTDGKRALDALEQEETA